MTEDEDVSPEFVELLDEFIRDNDEVLRRLAGVERQEGELMGEVTE